MIPLSRSLALALCLLLLSASPALAEKPVPGKISPEKYEVRASRGHLVPMRDGVRLSVDVYRPDPDGKFPAILIQTPYNNNGLDAPPRARWFASRGYVVAMADSRGRYDSEGDWDPFNPKHKTDGFDLVEWLPKQAWCDGKVGALGRSYSGWTQWWTATQAPPALKAIVPEVAPPDAFFNAPYQNGVLTSWALDWAGMMAGRTNQVVGEGPYGGFTATRARDMMKLPYLDLLKVRGAVDAPWFGKWLHGNLATADYWRAIAYQGQEHWSKVTVPSLNVTGWFDANHPGSPMNYEGMKKFGATPAARRPSMIIGPWPHSFNRDRKVGADDYGPDAVIDWDGVVCRWFDHHLKGAANGQDASPPVHVFVMGRNQWRAEKDWPLPQTKWTKYYLHGQGQANSHKGDGRLSVTPPGDEPFDRYVYDPGDPTPSPFKGGHLEDGAADTRGPAGRDDVLVYATPVLEEDLEVVGPISAELYAATTAKDTDWMMRLVDVAPDGTARLLCDGVMRARCRDPKTGEFDPEKLSAVEPGQALKYVLRFWRGTGHVFKKGHRVRVEVSSAYYPYYLRNLNSGADNLALETRSYLARQKVFHDTARPSHIVLPVIPAK